MLILWEEQIVEALIAAAEQLLRRDFDYGSTRVGFTVESRNEGIDVVARLRVAVAVCRFAQDRAGKAQ